MFPLKWHLLPMECNGTFALKMRPSHFPLCCQINIWYIHMIYIYIYIIMNLWDLIVYPHVFHIQPHVVSILDVSWPSFPSAKRPGAQHLVLHVSSDTGEDGSRAEVADVRGSRGKRGRCGGSGLPGLLICYKKLLKMAIEIVSFPINSMVIFHSYVNVYQRVLMLLACWCWL